MTDFLHGLDDSRPVTCGVNIFFNFFKLHRIRRVQRRKAKKEAERAEKAKQRGEKAAKEKGGRQSVLQQSGGAAGR